MTDNVSRPGDEVGISLTPMIDIVFQLLIFFILVGGFRTPEGLLAAPLPDGHDCGGPIEDVRITIRRNPANPDCDIPDVLVELVDASYRGAAILDENDGTLSMLRREANHPQQGIVIVAGGRVRFGWVIKAVNAAARAGFEKVTFAAPIKAP